MNRFNINPHTNKQYSPRYWALYNQRVKLPIWSHKSKFFDVLNKNQCILLEAHTGSGKTTQIPQWCVEWLCAKYPNKRPGVCCTQPRRIAVYNSANRVAREMDVEIGQEVGYSIRFEENVSHRTLLKYCTDGVLLSETSRSRNQMLENYDIIILDEVHERTLNTDVLLCLVKSLMTVRENLKVIVMSATLGTGNFAEYFPSCFQMSIPGRTYPVEIIYSDCDCRKGEYLEKSVDKVMEIYKTERVGDILLFLTGQDEIDDASEVIEARIKKLRIGEELEEMTVVPLYSAIQHEQKHLVFQNPENCRRCIVATNLAETSITIDGVMFVVDSGFCKRKKFDPKTKIDSVDVHRISRASAIQRAGRAGRTRPGKCFRMYTEHRFNKLMKPIYPEIAYSNLDNIVLRLKKIGIEEILSLEFMEPPPRELIVRAIDKLKNLGAFDVFARITTRGSQMCDLPVDTVLARMLLESVQLHCSKEVIIICAMLSSPKCFRKPKERRLRTTALKANRQFIARIGDHFTLLNVYNAFVKYGRSEDWCKKNYLNFRSLQYADDVCNQLDRLMFQKLNLKVISSEPNLCSSSKNIIKAMIAGSFMKVAFFRSTADGLHKKSQKGYYLTMESQLTDNKNALQYSIQSVLYEAKKEYGPRPKWVLYNEALQTKDQNILRAFSVIRPKWLAELAPAYCNKFQIGTELREMLEVAKRSNDPAEFVDESDFIGSINSTDD